MSIREGRELAESSKWIFVDFIPLLYDKKSVARQLQVEMWLNPSPIMKELKVKKVTTNRRDQDPSKRYII
ncbi:MAG: hypothetical protein PVH12_06100 [Candidatus Bathyarchaeota archaeon]|jgi:hypothetical protein